MTLLFGLTFLVKVKRWVGSLVFLVVCLVYFGGMCKGGKNVLFKLGMYIVFEGQRRRGMEGGSFEFDGGRREQVVQKDM